MVNLTDENINKLNTNFCFFGFFKKRKQTQQYIVQNYKGTFVFVVGWPCSGSGQRDENIDITVTE